MCQVLVEVLKYFKIILRFHKEFMLRQGVELPGKVLQVLLLAMPSRYYCFPTF